MRGPGNPLLSASCSVGESVQCVEDLRALPYAVPAAPSHLGQHVGIDKTINGGLCICSGDLELVSDQRHIDDWSPAQQICQLPYSRIASSCDAICPALADSFEVGRQALPLSTAANAASAMHRTMESGLPFR